VEGPNKRRGPQKRTIQDRDISNPRILRRKVAKRANWELGKPW